MRKQVLVAALCLAMAAVAHAAGVEKKTTTNNGVTLTYFDQGSGHAVLMIPSLGRGASDFDDLAGKVQAAGYRVLRIEPRGIDGSSGPMTGLSMHDLVGDCVHILEAAGVKHAVVLGHDDGNRFARATAAYDPGLVTGVILIGAGGKIKASPAATMALLQTFNPKLAPEAHLAAVKTAFFASGNDASVWKDGWYPQTAAMEREAVEATPQADWWTAGTTVPVLVVQGEQDVIAVPANAEALKADIGDRAEVIPIDGAGHALLPEQPAAVGRIVVGWLQAKKL